MEEWLLFAMVITVILPPLFFFPVRLLDGFILPQIGTTAIGVSAAFVLLTLVGLFPCNLVSWLALLYLFYLLASSAWSTVPHNSLRDVPLVFGYLMALVICSVLFENRISMVGVSLGVFFSACFNCIYGIGQRFLFDPLFPERLSRVWEDGSKDKKGVCRDNRVIGTLGNTTFFSGYLITTLPFLVFLSVEVSHWFLLSVLLVCVVIRMTKSRAGLLGLVGFIVMFLVLSARQGWVLDWLIQATDFLHSFGSDVAFSVSISFFILVCFVCYELRNKSRKDKLVWSNVNDELLYVNIKKIGLSDKSSTWNTMLDSESGGNETYWAQLRFRFRYWKAAWEMIKERPLQGFGLKTYRKEVYETQAKLHSKDGKFLSATYETPQPREVHNDYIEAFMEGGFVGGLLLLAIMGIVIGHGLAITNSILGVALMASLAAVMISNIFFFPLRLGPSSVLIFIAFALVEGVSGNLLVGAFQPNVFITLGVIGIIAAMLWEGVVKPNLGNYYFTQYNFIGNAVEKEKKLIESIKCCPKETIFRTHAMIGYLEGFPQEAAKHADVMHHHYDGMTPGWVMYYNKGVVDRVRKNWEDSDMYLQKSVYMLPSFGPTRRELKYVWPLAPFPRKGPIVKNLSDDGVSALKQYVDIVKALQKKGEEVKALTPEGINAIRVQKAELAAIQSEIANKNLGIIGIVLAEKVRMNVPEDWAVDIDNGIFLSPREIADNNFQIQDTGHPGVVIARRPPPEPQPEPQQDKPNLKVVK